MVAAPARGDLLSVLPLAAEALAFLLAQAESPLTPRPDKCRTCAWDFGPDRLQRYLAQKRG